MKRKIAFVLAAALMLGLTACGAANDSGNANDSPVQAESSQTAQSGEQGNDEPGRITENSEGDGAETGEGNTETGGTGKILIAYFAVAENSKLLWKDHYSLRCSQGQPSFPNARHDSGTGTGRRGDSRWIYCQP